MTPEQKAREEIDRQLAAQEIIDVWRTPWINCAALQAS
jgi:hypothetical protein